MSLPRRPLAVVFDLDGTLIDSETVVREALFAACREFGVTMSDAQFLSLVGRHRAANDEALLGFYGADFPLERFNETTRAYVGERVAPLKPGAAELMDVLDELDLPFGLATSSQRSWVDRHFAAHAIAARFRSVVTRLDVVNTKPHPEPFLKAATELGVAPMNALALEDSHTGVRAAHAAGCMTIMAPDLLAPNEEMRAKTVRIVGSLHEVAELLR
jgi:HAD superfamily hydrolase (TIGR01509 family)